jgi:hypothetical protein
MLTAAGDPVIVDFDRARFNPIAVKEWEMDILKGALGGETHDFSMRSPGPYKGTPSLKASRAWVIPAARVIPTVMERMARVQRA